MKKCVVVKEGAQAPGGHGASYANGISAETAGAEAICLVKFSLPPGGRTNAHFHESHESAIYVLSGNGHQMWGENLENRDVVEPGMYVYFPAGLPHVVMNLSETEPLVGVIARTDPSNLESVVPRPDLEHHVDEFLAGILE